MTSNTLLSTYELPQVNDTALDASFKKAIADLDKIDTNVEDPPEPEEPEEVVEPEGEEIEESDDTEGEEEPEEEEEPEVEPEPVKKDRREKLSEKDKYRKLQNDKHRAQAAEAAAQERVRELEEMLNDSLSAGTYHYGKTVYSELERAKDTKRKAYDMGDMEAALVADEAIFKAMIAINELEKWANESSKTGPKPAAKAQAAPEVDRDMEFKRELAADWLEGHPYLNASSRKYDPNLEAKVVRFVKKLDYDLETKRQQHLHYTPEYFDKIDDYIDAIKTKKSSNTLAALPPVGGVRNSYTGKSKAVDPAKITLTKEEKELIKSMKDLGITEESYRQNRMKKKED
jgi:hypothetical protein